MSQIKTKKSIQFIKTKDNTKNISHFIKRNSVKTKSDSKESNNESPSAKAIDQVKTTGIKTAYDAKHHTVETLRNVSKNVEKKRILSRRNNDIQTLETQSVKRDYPIQIESFKLKKLKLKLQDKLKLSATSNPVIKKTGEIVKGIAQVTKKTINLGSNLLTIGSMSLCLITISLFFGVFGVLAQDNGINSEIIPLSPEVLAYEETITLYAEQYGIPDYVSIIQAIMMHETKGLGNDPMNSSQFVYNTRYPQVWNGIEEPEYSVEVGVRMFAECISLSGTTSPSDSKKLYLAIQGYNSGLEYITWVKQTFGDYSRANAKVYYDNTGKGDFNYVQNVMQYVGFSIRGGLEPNFNNEDAWIKKNPYAKVGLFGQCTWFAWGRFYELYGYDPGFRGNGYQCAEQLVAAHPDKFELSYTTVKAGAVFSGQGRNHVGIVIKVDGDTITVQEGNLDGKTNTFQEAKSDWHTKTYTIQSLRNTYGGVVFANPR